MDLPGKSEADSIYTYGFAQKAKQWAGDDRGYLTFHGVKALLSGLRPYQAPKDRNPSLALGSDYGAAEPLSKASVALGDETARRQTDATRIDRYEHDDGLYYKADFAGLGETMVYEMGLFLDEILHCRHVLFRPIYPADRLEVILTFVVV